MEKLCPNCGEPLPEGAELCPSCALPASAAPEDINDVDEIILDAHSAEKSESALPAANGFREELAEEAKKEKKRKGRKPSDAPTDKRYKPVGFFRFMLFILLYCIPFAGFILAIVMSFAPKNKSFKSFSRAAVVYIVIMTAVSIILTSVISLSVLALVTLATGGPILLSTVAGTVALLLAGQISDIDALITVGREVFNEICILIDEIIDVIGDIGVLINYYNSGKLDGLLENADKIEEIIGGSDHYNENEQESPENNDNSDNSDATERPENEQASIFKPAYSY